MNFKQEDFKYKEDSSNPAVLGVLEGPCADIINPTRNGRKYSEELWEKVFNSPLVKEKLECGGIFGESQHPADRQEVDTEKIAIAMKEAPVKHDDGKLYARFYILDTPCGRILKTLADFGYRIGISSRGSGETFTDTDGNESVDPDTYDFECFDAVLLPSVKEARMSVVTESVESSGEKLKVALNESLKKATPDERIIMEETLKELDISYEQQNAVDIDEVTQPQAVENSEAVVRELQEALKQVKQLQSSVGDLQEKLSVSYTKEARMQQQLQDYRSAIRKLNKKSSCLPNLNALNEQLNKEIQDKTAEVSSLKKQLVESKKEMSSLTTLSTELKESLRASRKMVQKLKTNNQQLQEQLNECKDSYERKLESIQKDLDIKQDQYASKLKRSNQLVEKYKDAAQASVDRYIKSQAIRLGVSPAEISNRLNESYTFDDIDDVCEQLQTMRLNMSKLPFSPIKENVKVQINPSVNEALLPKGCDNDDIDDSLLRLANLH